MKIKSRESPKSPRVPGIWYVLFKYIFILLKGIPLFMLVIVTARLQTVLSQSHYHFLLFLLEIGSYCVVQYCVGLKYPRMTWSPCFSILSSWCNRAAQPWPMSMLYLCFFLSQCLEYLHIADTQENSELGMKGALILA